MKNAHEFISTLEAKDCAYLSLCAARNHLLAHVPPESRAVAAEWIELEAMRSPALAGMPHLDAAILLVLREIAVCMEYLAAELRATVAAAGAPGDR